MQAVITPLQPQTKSRIFSYIQGLLLSHQIKPILVSGFKLSSENIFLTQSLIQYLILQKIISPTGSSPFQATMFYGQKSIHNHQSTHAQSIFFPFPFKVQCDSSNGHQHRNREIIMVMIISVYATSMSLGVYTVSMTFNRPRKEGIHVIANVFHWIHRLFSDHFLFRFIK